MPYRRAYRGKKRPARRYRRRFAPKGVARRATAAYRMARRLRGMVRPEFKWRDVILPPTTIPNTIGSSSIVNFTQIPQGSTVNDREGNRILLKSWMPRIQITGGESCRVRLMVLQDTRRNYNTGTGSQAAISATDILASTTYPIISPYNLQVSGKFKVLKDVVINYDHDDFGKTTLRWFFRFNSVMKWGDSTQTEPNVNGLYLVMVSDASSVPNITCFSRFRWIDG